MAVRRGAARLAGRTAWREISVPPVGRVSVACVAVVAPSAPEPSDATWILVRDGRQGRLVLGAGAALQMAAAILGLPSPRLLRPLGAAERGIVAAVIAAVASFIDAGVGLSLRTQGTFGADLVRVVVAFRAGKLEGRVFLDVPWDWIPAAEPSVLAAAAIARGLRVTVRVEIARTSLAARDWSSARCGDTVVFDGCPAALDAAGYRPVRIACGSHGAEGEIAGDGAVRMRQPFQEHVGRLRTAPDPNRRMSMSNVSDDHPPASSIAVLASAPIEVVAEIGRIELRADELLGLAPGAVLAMGALGATAVDLRVGDRLWARGELVEVDGQLGVRITEVVAAPEPSAPAR